MTNLEIVELLRKMAAAYTILGENRFKISAYENAATAVEHSTSELKDLWENKELDSVPSLGKAIISHLDEIFRTGNSKHIDEILKKIDPTVFLFLDIPGLGPKKAVKLVKALKLKSLSDLEKAARDHKIAHLENFGFKSEKDILENISRFRKGAIKELRMVLPMADVIADELINYLGVKVDKLGSLRRRLATIGDIDLAVATNNPKKIIQRFVSYPKKVNLIEQGQTGASILLASGRQADLRVAKPEEYGAMLQYFTGSKYHNIRLREFALKKHLSLNEYGINGKSFRTEKDLYNYLGLDYIPPELREDNGEVEAALNHKLPKLVKLDQIKGDLQTHSNFDLETSHDSGANSIEELRSTAIKFGYEYIGITNHNSSSKHTKDQILTKIVKQKNYIEQLNSSTKSTRILSLLEVDILPDGSLPVLNEALNLLDACLVAIHSSFQMNKEEMTNRVLKGLSHPVAKILAHPTGRLLEERDEIKLDWPKIFVFCKTHNKALEINASSHRLDLPDILVREAVKFGVKLSIGTDAHSIDGLSMMPYGVSVARRGWAQSKDIINTWTYDKIIHWLHERR